MKTKLLFLLAVFLFFGKFMFAQNPTYTLKVDSMRLIDIPPYQDNAIEFGVYLTHTNAPTPFIIQLQQIFFSFNPEIVLGNPLDSANILKYIRIGSQLPETYQPRNPSIRTATNPSATIMRLGPNQIQNGGIYITGATNLLIVKMRLWSRAGPFNLTNLSIAFRNPPIVTFATRLFANLGTIFTDITTPSTHSIDSTGLPNPLPVEMASFASVVNRNNVVLKWSTSTETSNSGFDIERKLVGATDRINAGNVAGSGTTFEERNYTFSERISTRTYIYRLQQIDFNGNHAHFSLSNEVVIGVPSLYALSQNYPNPFNPTTKIDYELPYDGKISITLYDLTGREVSKLVYEVKTAGYYTV